ncbi:hypothetical protein B566_EDAN011587 [Ephemera danica]|nr:hypothetical protein B566_EDAN011587 [Ephemera danica]
MMNGRTEIYIDEDSEKNDPFNKYDIFTDEPPIQKQGSVDAGKFTLLFMRISKALISILLFITVLGGGVISKGTMLFMTSQLRKEPSIAYCDKEYNNEPGEQFVAVLPDVERVAWVWVLFFSILAPELGCFLRSGRILLFKPMSWSRPYLRDFMVVMATETCGIVGVSMLAFSVLPDLDVLKGVMLTNCLCLVPAIIALLGDIFEDTKTTQETNDNTSDDSIAITPNPKSWLLWIVNSINRNKKILKISIGILAVVSQLSGFIVWPLVHRDVPSLWLTPAAILLTSFYWWENYIPKKSKLGFLKFLADVKLRQKRTRYPIYAIVSIWKSICLFSAMLIIWTARGESVPDLFNLFSESFEEHYIPIYKIPIAADDPKVIPEATYDGMDEISKLYPSSAPWLLLIQVLAAYIAYVTGKCACRVMVQGFSYATPVTITVPVSLIILIIMCAIRNEDPCAYQNTIPGYLFFRLPPNEFFGHFIGQQHAWIWLFWLGSQIWITRHIWYPKCQRLAPTEQIFVSPMYSGILVDQTLSLNRRIDDQPPEKRTQRVVEVDRTNDEVELRRQSNNYEDNDHISNDAVPHVKACATMWHENREEMIEMLKSVMRMDAEQFARKTVREKFYDVNDPRRNKDYFEYENFLRTVNAAAIHVHGEDHDYVGEPTVISTPYGGRLEYDLPGETQLIVHLKDSAKIRHKKRWSQCMYMYYLLGYHLLELPEDRQDVVAENTYLLALDGDIDFRPEAVIKLVDLMKKDRNLGAACGRIHPVGTGAMVWYQKFEYAVGHWLQKATEHVIGCVLCSPGCFSLFRGSALMDKNVMKKYTTTSEEARHYVQYDQGEDRWLCTLLLQQGYRVEYCAASDSYTHAPEKFNEFYNQRRRWVPSTMANIFDLLGDRKYVVKANDNISNIYITYQILLMVGSILGPGTILLMLVGAFNTVFGWSLGTSMLVNVIPIIVYMLVCYFATSKTQITVAMIYSIVYVLVMVAVLIGLLVQISEDGALAPTSLFFFIVTAQFIITGLLHPLEIGCLPCGIIYYITVPSMYLLLIIYSLFNLNNVSWGTREVAKSPEEIASEKVAANQQGQQILSNKKDSHLTRIFNTFRSKVPSLYSEEGSFEFSLAGLFKCFLCPYPKVLDEKEEMARILNKLDDIKNSRNPAGLSSLQEENDSSSSSSSLSSSSDNEDHSGSTFPVVDASKFSTPCYWRDTNEILVDGKESHITHKEEFFWNGLIKKYLEPLKKDEKKEKRVASELKELRDKSVFSFFLLNAVFVLTLFLLQSNRDITFLNITWPLRGQNSSVLEYDKKNDEILVTTDKLVLEPIGLLFLASFGTEDLGNDFLPIVRELQKIQNEEETKPMRLSLDDEDMFVNGRKRPTIRDLEKNHHNQQKKRVTLADALHSRINDDGAVERVLRKSNIPTNRRDTIQNYRHSIFAARDRLSSIPARDSYNSLNSQQESLVEANGPVARRGTPINITFRNTFGNRSQDV